MSHFPLFLLGKIRRLSTRLTSSAMGIFAYNLLGYFQHKYLFHLTSSKVEFAAKSWTSLSARSTRLGSQTETSGSWSLSKWRFWNLVTKGATVFTK